MRLRRIGILALLILLVGVGCGGNKGPAGEGGGFALPSLDGDTVRLDALKGKVVLIDFWATWCPPCKAYVPYLVGLQNKYRADGFVVLGVSNDGVGAMQQFRDNTGINYRLLVADNETMRRYKITAIPTSYLLDKKGNVVKREVGFDPGRVSQLEEEIKRLLSEK